MSTLGTLDWGFTGSSEITTEPQRGAFIDFIDNHRVGTFRHGDCIEADAFAHSVVRQLWPSARIIGHIPTKSVKRAFCDFDEEMEPLPYLKRNEAIARACKALLSMPKDIDHGHGGTWFTINCARRLHKPVAIFWPDGSVTYEANSPRNQLFWIESAVA